MDASKDLGPDFANGVSFAKLRQGVTPGHVRGTAALCFRQQDSISIVGGTCSHFGAPLKDAHVAGEQILCPWHHACFSLKTGQVTKAPGRQPLPRWQVERQGDTVRAGKPVAPAPASRAGSAWPKSVGIVGAGAAAVGAILELQQGGYAGDIHVYTGESDGFYERIKLSKGFLAGKLDKEKLALDTSAFVDGNKVRLHSNTAIRSLDPAGHTLTDAKGGVHRHDAILLATGGVPKSLPKVAVDRRRTFTLRSLADAEALTHALKPGARVVIVGSSFIGMEAAASLVARGLTPHVIMRDELPFEPILGRDLGQVLRSAHDRAGVVLHKQRSVKSVDAAGVVLDDGKALPADVILLAVGVGPETSLARDAGLKVDNGIVVDEAMRTSAAGIWAAGDVARVRERASHAWRIEHWAVAEQMGRVAAQNMLGRPTPYRAVPFFWTEQFDYKLRYVGHVDTVTRAETFGDIEDKKAAIGLFEGDRLGAVVTVGRDDISMACEAALRDGRPEALPGLLRT